MTSALRDFSEAISDHLLTHQIISIESIFDDGLQFLPQTGRNAVIAVSGRTTRLVVKEYRPRLSAHESFCEREGAFYKLAMSNSVAPLARIIPTFVHFDALSGRLVLEAAEGIPANYYMGRTYEELECLARSIGADLATIHSVEASPYPNSIRPLALHLASEVDVNPKTERAARLAVAAAEMARKHGWPDAVAMSAEPETLVHADLRLSNILCEVDKGNRFIDWETAGTGQPVMDLGIVLGSIAFVSAADSSQRHFGLVDGPAKIAIKALLDGYKRCRALPCSAAISSMACMSIYQFAFESAQQDRPTPSDVDLVGFVESLDRWLNSLKAVMYD